MTNNVFQDIPDRPRPWLDAIVAVVLGAALLALGAMDVRSYRTGRHKVWREFPLLSQPGDVRLGNVELYRGRFALVQFDNIGQIENDDGRHFRHALGPESAIEISAERTRGRLSFQFFNPIEGQDLTLSFNGQMLEQITGASAGNLERTYALTLRPGVNRFALAFARYNHAGAQLTASDSRSIAGTFFALDLTLD